MCVYMIYTTYTLYSWCNNFLLDRSQKEAGVKWYFRVDEGRSFMAHPSLR